MRGRKHGVDDAGADAACAVLFDHGPPDGRGGQGTEALALLVAVVQLLHVERDARHWPVEPVVRRGRGHGRLVFQRQPTGHRRRLVAHGWRHVRQHNTVDGHSPPAAGGRGLTVRLRRVVGQETVCCKQRDIILFWA